MSSTSVFDNVNVFKKEFDSHRNNFLMASLSGKKDAFKKNADTNKRIDQIYKTAQGSIDSWTEKPESWFGVIKNKVRNLLLKSPSYDSKDFNKAEFYKKPFMWLGKTIHNLGDKISPPAKKESADEPYKFGELDEAEMVRLEKKANVIKTVAKTCLIAGIILLGVGSLAPLALAALLITLPESIALSVIIGCTALGVAGVVGAVATPIIKNSKPVNEHEAETNKEYQRFVNEVVQKKDGGFNLKRKDVQNGEVFKIFKEWKDSLEQELSKKNLKKLQAEREALKKEFPI